MIQSLLALSLIVLLLPAGALAADAGSLNVAPIQNLSTSIIALINTVVVPFVFAIAFLVFIWGVYTYFIAGGASEEKRSEGAKFVLSGLIGFAAMITVWGLVNILVGTIPGLAGQKRPDLPCFSGNCAIKQQQQGIPY